MASPKLTREEMWAKQQISCFDVDYDAWAQQRTLIKQMSRISRGCLFTVDVFKSRYDFASGSFADVFGFNPSWLEDIQNQGDLLEEYIHPDDRSQLIERQLKHSEFIYSLPSQERNDYKQSFQFRMLNRKQEYVNVISSQQVIRKDRNGKAWIVMGAMEISPDQHIAERIKCSVLNMRTGDISYPLIQTHSEEHLTKREKQILDLIRQGLLSKEIACKLGLSIYTINNHRKSILAKLHADNAIEAINQADILGL